PVDAPEGTDARPTVPSASSTSTSTVGLPRESRISRARISSMIAMSAARLYGRGPRKGRNRKPNGRGARTTGMLRRASALLPALALLWFGAATALAATPTWTLAVSENPSDQANYLTAASMLSGTDAWAVGAWYRPASTPGTLTEHWDGATWTAVPSPNATQGYNELFDVHAIATDDVWAVGYHNIANYGSEKSMTLHWDGATWKIVRSVNIGANANILRGVAGASSNDVWAVGLGSSTSLQSGRPLTEHWDGTAWTVVSSPNGTLPTSSLTGVVALSGNDAWAVGVTENQLLVSIKTLTLHWDGSVWSVVPSPNPGPDYNWLDGVAAL